MAARLAVGVLALLTAGSAWGKTYYVRNALDSGAHSLRWAITEANNRVGPDIIEFKPLMMGKKITLNTPLPPIAGNRLAIIGDINDDGIPDVTLNGAKLSGTGPGLQVTYARKVTIRGLTIRNFPEQGLYLIGAEECYIYGCHIGTDPTGLKHTPNQQDQVGAEVELRDCLNCEIGGADPRFMNVISAGLAAAPDDGIYLVDCEYVAVQNNHIGVTREGNTALGVGGRGILLTYSTSRCRNIRIGGTAANQRNVIAGCSQAVVIANGRVIDVQGNYFGLGANGYKTLATTQDCMSISMGSRACVIGGTTTAARNLFVSDAGGIYLTGADTRNNYVQGNYFGLSHTGKSQRPMGTGVQVGSGAGRVYIGADGTTSGNRFCSKGSATKRGVVFTSGGNGSKVSRNWFGILEGGADADTIMEVGVAVWGAVVDVTKNKIRWADAGIYASGASADVEVYFNRVEKCAHAVALQNSAVGHLGDLGNASTADDGGNYLHPNNNVAIVNGTANAVKAEGNDFGSTSASVIDDAIYDGDDVPGLGLVDYDPLKGGVAPTGGIVGVAGLAAVPTAVGAQVTFTLTADATVTARVLNTAGRPVGTICRERASDVGANTLVWNAQTDSGLAAPNGQYLVEVVARSEGGSQARALTQVRLAR